MVERVKKAFLIFKSILRKKATLLGFGSQCGSEAHICGCLPPIGPSGGPKNVAKKILIELCTWMGDLQTLTKAITVTELVYSTAKSYVQFFNSLRTEPSLGIKTIARSTEEEEDDDELISEKISSAFRVELI